MSGTGVPQNDSADIQRGRSPSLQPSPFERAANNPPRPSISIDGTEVDEKKEFPRLESLPQRQGSQDQRDFAAAAFSPTGQRADASRLDDDLELLRAERLISHQEHEEMERNRSRPAYQRHNTELEDTFNPGVVEDHKPVKRRDEDAALYKFWAFLRKFPRFIRYLVYLIPGAAILLVPVLLGVFAIDEEANPVGGEGGTYLMWFGIWLEIVWASLWVSRMITSLMPHLILLVAKISGSTNAKKWKDIGHQMELHIALFLWLLAVLVSFKPTCDGHRVPSENGEKPEWINIVFKIIIAFFVLAALNFVEKILIQWIAAAFHERTYATRIENNKGDIRQLVTLFEYAKGQLQETDSFWQGSQRESATGTQTPMQTLQTLHENAQKVLGKVGQVAGRVGNDFIGRKAVDMNHPRKVVSELLRTTSSSHTLARLIYRSLVRDGQEMVFHEDVRKAYSTDEEADAAFNVFDKDLNGDISMDEFEAVTTEIGMEKKAIAASLKDLDSVIQKLDKVFLFIIVVITIIVFISIISGSAAAGLASAGSSVLGLAWMLQATAQEFLQSIIFVFVKHPFDVGDRVTVYGSTGANMTGDDYYVTEISLLYTEFKKLQGHVVQAPNSLLNTLFILNQRRSNGLADPVQLKIRFGTPAWMIDELKARMLQFCVENKRDYQPTILAELSTIDEMRAAELYIVFIHKSNFQNELLRIARHGKFMMELMYQMEQIGIQSPYRIEPGGSREYPMYWTGPPPPSYSREQGNDGDQGPSQPFPSAPAPAPSQRPGRSASVTGGNGFRPVVAGHASEAALNNFGDVFDNRREHFQATRLASIKEKDRAEKIAKETKDTESEPRGSTSALRRETSNNSQTRSRMWSRPRAGSRTHAGRPSHEGGSNAGDIV
jgi:small-conductance mechanosensitive channel